MPEQQFRVLSDEEFTELRDKLLNELSQRRAGVAERDITPDGPAMEPPADGPKLWELSPEEFRARAHAALWPEKAPAHTWVPQEPITIGQYLKDGA